MERVLAPLGVVHEEEAVASLKKKDNAQTHTHNQSINQLKYTMVKW